METGWHDQAKIGVHRAFGSAWLRLGAVKGYADGSLGSTTAFFFQRTPMRRHPGAAVGRNAAAQQMRSRLIAADKAGLQLCVHAIGDAAISQILDLFGDIVQSNGTRDRRLRIEHAQHIAPKDFDRFAALHVDRFGAAAITPSTMDAGPSAASAPERIEDDLRVPHADRQRRPARARHRLARRAAQPDAHAVRGDRRARRSTANIRTAGCPSRTSRLRKRSTAYTAGSAFAEFQEREKGTPCARNARRHGDPQRRHLLHSGRRASKT